MTTRSDIIRTYTIFAIILAVIGTVALLNPNLHHWIRHSTVNALIFGTGVAFTPELAKFISKKFSNSQS